MGDFFLGGGGSCMGGVLQLFWNTQCCFRNVVEKTLEHFWNCYETVLKCSSIIQEFFIVRYMGQILEMSSTIVLEKLKCLF